MKLSFVCILFSFVPSCATLTYQGDVKGVPVVVVVGGK